MVHVPMSSSEYALFCAERQRVYTEKRENKIGKIIERINSHNYPSEQLENIIAVKIGIRPLRSTKGEKLDRGTIMKEIRMVLANYSLDKLEKIYEQLEQS